MNEPVHIMDRAETFMLGCKDFIDLRKNSGRLFNLFLAFELAYDWLKIFDSYDRFIEAFKLKPLADRGIIKEIRTAYIGDMLSVYRTYADICTEAIKERGRL